MHKIADNEIFPTDSNRGVHDMPEDHKPQTSDAIELFVNSWNKPSLKC